MLCLPSYSPNFNPIENVFTKLTALLRRAAARTIDEPWDASRNGLPDFSATECVNYSSQPATSQNAKSLL